MRKFLFCKQGLVEIHTLLSDFVAIGISIFFSEVKICCSGKIFLQYYHGNL